MARDRAPRSIDIEQEMALIEKAQQLGGHFPNEEALNRARRILDGTTTADEARAEVAAKYGFSLREPARGTR